ncbi:MAG: large conductance mechanosensitive channel protein MscL [Clostridia bacterium]|nr:large conductance mechanosensitive channel protein MscL [Clostridia bacterium]
MKKFFKEFGDFIKRGNILDLAIGIIIGGAFQKIVASLVKDIIMPLIGIIGGVNIAEAKWVMKEAVLDGAQNIIKPEIALTYGIFIQTVIDFVIIALAIFVGMKAMSAVGKKMAEARASLVEKVLNEKEKTEEDKRD